MIPEIKSSMAMQEETEESSYMRLDEERGDDEERRDSDEGQKDGYEAENPRTKLQKLGQDRRRYDEKATFARIRRRSSPAKPRPAPPPAVRVRMLMDEDLSSATKG